MRHSVGFKPITFVALLGLLTLLVPEAPVDPWNLFSPYKITKMVFALALIQALSSVLVQYLGVRSGSLVTGFLGGLISSTATTASLARRSKTTPKQFAASDTLTFLAATGAMLFEGMALVITGSTEIHWSTLFVFVGPVLTTVAVIAVLFRRIDNKHKAQEISKFQILPIVQLAIFIVAILTVSKVSQNLFGQNGIVVLTSLVSLFEIHGSIIANVQLHESGLVSVPLLNGLLVISLMASYISKLFLIHTMGSATLKASALKITLLLSASLLIGGALAWGFS